MTLQRGSLDILDLGKLVQIAGFDEKHLHRRFRKGALITGDGVNDIFDDQYILMTVDE